MKTKYKIYYVGESFVGRRHIYATSEENAISYLTKIVGTEITISNIEKINE